MNHLGPPSYLHGDITWTINNVAVSVHRALGPGFLEAIYEEAMCVEFTRRGIVVNFGEAVMRSRRVFRQVD